MKNRYKKLQTIHASLSSWNPLSKMLKQISMGKLLKQIIAIVVLEIIVNVIVHVNFLELVGAQTTVRNYQIWDTFQAINRSLFTNVHTSDVVTCASNWREAEFCDAFIYNSNTSMCYVRMEPYNFTYIYGDGDVLYTRGRVTYLSINNLYSLQKFKIFVRKTSLYLLM